MANVVVPLSIGVPLHRKTVKESSWDSQGQKDKCLNLALSTLEGVLIPVLETVILHVKHRINAMSTITLVGNIMLLHSISVVFLTIHHYRKGVREQTFEWTPWPRLLWFNFDSVRVQDSVSIYGCNPFRKIGQKGIKALVLAQHRYDLGTELFVSAKSRLLWVFKNEHLKESITAKQGGVLGK